MTTQIICDDCGEPIDVTQPYYSASVIKQQEQDGVMTVVEDAVSLDYHLEHLPQVGEGDDVAPMVQPLPA